PFHLGMHGFHHHYGIIHHDPDHYDQGKESDQVQGESEKLHEKEGAHNGYRYGQGGNQGGPPVLQEQKDHQGDQQKGLDKGLDHFLYGSIHKAGYVITHLIIHALEEHAFLEFRHPLLYLVYDLLCVGARQLFQDDRGRGPAVELGLHIKVFGPEFQLCHILYPQDPSILGGSYWNVPVLGQGVEPPRIPEHVLQGGSIATIRVFPDLSGGGLQVLLVQGPEYVIGGNPIGQHSIRFEPNADGVFLGSQYIGITDPFDPFQFGEDVEVRKIVDKTFGHRGIVTE